MWLNSRTAIFIPVCNRFSLITIAKIDAFDCKTMKFHYLFNEMRLFILNLNNYFYGKFYQTKN